MNTKLLKKLLETLLVILIVISGVFIISSYFNNSDSNTPDFLLPDVKLKDVIAINYSSKNINLAFKKSKDDWYINDHLASESSVEISISKVLAITISSTVSTVSSSYSKYGVDNDSNKIELITDQKTITVFLGSLNNTNFARLSNSATTYSINEDIISVFNVGESYFRNKVITLFNPNTVNSFQINNDSYKVTNGIWYKNAIQKDNQSVLALLLKLSSIEGKEFATESERATTSSLESYLTIAIQLEDKNFEFRIINYNNNFYVEYNNEVFTVDNDLIQNIINLNSTL